MSTTTTLVTLPIKTALGVFVARYSDHGLASLHFPTARPPNIPKPSGATARIRQWHAVASRAVKATLAGKSPGELPPLDVSGGTEFQQQVWEELLWIPSGETRSYAEIAESIKKPKAARAVGGACGANPIPVLIPCHRVLAADGKIGGFSGGLEWKRKLLALEAVAVR
jgi:O-6-methylguanine DNA methyltransferase